MFLAILVVFHQPILSFVVRQVVRHYAAKENLQVDFWMEGTVITNLSVRNLHVVPAGPTDVESIDADVVRADYSLFGLLRHGLSGFLKNVEVRSARIALNPAKTPPKPATKKPSKKSNLPTRLFPDRLKLSDISLVVRDKPHDFFLQNVDIDLDQRLPGKLHIGRMQLTNGQNWSDISGATSYAKKNLVIRDVRLNDQDRIDLLNVDASDLANNKLELKVESKIGGGSVSGSMQWAKQRSTVSRKIKLHAENISAEALNKYVNTPENFLGGKIEKVDVDLGGILKSPSSLNGTIDARPAGFSYRRNWIQQLDVQCLGKGWPGCIGIGRSGPKRKSHLSARVGPAARSHRGSRAKHSYSGNCRGGG